jgi:outer membrane protein TolC
MCSSKQGERAEKKERLRMWKVAAIFLAASLAEAGSKRPEPAPHVRVPEAFRNQSAGGTDVLADRWWMAFGDPLLDQLIERAERANLEVRKADANLAAAEALRKGARSALLPEISTGGSVSQLRGGFNQGVIRAPSRDGESTGVISPFETTIISGRTPHCPL